MYLRKKIQEKLNKMNMNELSMIYEQIALMEKISTPARGKKKCRYSIDQVLEMTKSSKSIWSDTIKELREERI